MHWKSNNTVELFKELTSREDYKCSSLFTPTPKFISNWRLAGILAQGRYVSSDMVTIMWNLGLVYLKSYPQMHCVCIVGRVSRGRIPPLLLFGSKMETAVWGTIPKRYFPGRWPGAANFHSTHKQQPEQKIWSAQRLLHFVVSS